MTLPPARSPAPVLPSRAAGRRAAGRAPDDWPMFGRTIARNLANPLEKNVPDTWSVKKNKEKNVKW